MPQRSPPFPNDKHLLCLQQMRSEMQSLQPWIIEAQKFLHSAFYGRQNSLVSMSSDYSGNGSESDFLTFAYLSVDFLSNSWDSARTTERARAETFDRRVSYKRFRNGVKGPDLKRWLEATRHLTGELIVFAFPKEMARRLPPLRPSESFPLNANWKPKALEDAVRKGLLGALIIGHKLSEDGYLQWISDQDAAMANSAAEKDFMLLCSILADMLDPLRRRFVQFGTTEKDCSHLFREDLNSIPDLAAGMVAELLSSLRWRPPAGVSRPSSISKKCEMVANWFWHAPYQLKRLCLVVEDDATVSALEHLPTYRGS